MPTLVCEWTIPRAFVVRIQITLFPAFLNQQIILMKGSIVKDLVAFGVEYTQ